MLIIKYDAGTAKLKGDITPAAENAIEHTLMWRDRSIEYMNNRNAWRSGSPPQDSRRYCYCRRKRSFPTGLLPQVLRVLETHEVKYKLECSIDWHPAAEKSVPDWAWKHQIEIVETLLKWKRCLVQSPTASGIIDK